jgi:16S rRNA processing protein RimM
VSAKASDRYVVVGYIRRSHGVRGEVSVEVVSDVPERFARGATLSLLSRQGERRQMEIASVRNHSGHRLVKFVGVEDRDDALLLRGASLEIESDLVPEPPAGSYYYYQLVGCRCVDREQGMLGEVAEVLEDGGGLLLSVTAEQGSLLIPFVEEYIRKIDVEKQQIELELPSGLLELCVSPS